MPTPADPAPDTSATHTPPVAPDTIVLIHGFWVTPRTWEQWPPSYEAQGYPVHAPACPGL
jgi:pimeloyl-ACP methyl ester carboxylesterase